MKNQQFYVKTARLAVPIMMQNMITIGVNMVDNIMVGSLGENALGEGNVARVKEEAERFMKMGIILGALSTIIIILISDPVISCYNITPETAVIAKELMYSIGIIMLFRGVNSMMTKGVLRGGGDTRFLMVADILFLWVASVPLGYLAGVVLHWPAFWTYFFLKIDEIIKCFWCIWRLKSGKWIKKISG